MSWRPSQFQEPQKKNAALSSRLVVGVYLGTLRVGGGYLLLPNKPHPLMVRPPERRGGDIYVFCVFYIHVYPPPPPRDSYASCLHRPPEERNSPPDEVSPAPHALPCPIAKSRSIMSAVANLPPSPLRVAVLLLAPVQLLDVSPIDLFGMLTKEYLTACGLPAPLLRGAVASRIFYVAAQPGEDAVAECTAGAGLRVTHLLSDEECSPGRVHVVLIPGPDPKMVPGEAVRAFIRGHVGSGAAVLTVCTGVFAAGYAGVLEGRRATGPRALVGGLRGKFPGVRWEDKRWVCDGNVWSSGMVVPLRFQAGCGVDRGG